MMSIELRRVLECVSCSLCSFRLSDSIGNTTAAARLRRFLPPFHAWLLRRRSAAPYTAALQPRWLWSNLRFSSAHSCIKADVFVHQHITTFALSGFDPSSQRDFPPLFVFVTSPWPHPLCPARRLPRPPPREPPARPPLRANTATCPPTPATQTTTSTHNSCPPSPSPYYLAC
jgi:hypothetical protein